MIKRAALVVADCKYCCAKKTSTVSNTAKSSPKNSGAIKANSMAALPRRHRVSLEEREFLLALCLRAQKMSPAARYDLMEEVAKTYRQKLDIEEEAISGENLVRDLTAVLFSRMR